MRKLDNGDWLAESGDYVSLQKPEKFDDSGAWEEIPWIKTPGPWTQEEVDILMAKLIEQGGYPKDSVPVVDGLDLMVVVL